MLNPVHPVPYPLSTFLNPRSVRLLFSLIATPTTSSNENHTGYWIGNKTHRKCKDRQRNGVGGLRYSGRCVDGGRCMLNYFRSPFVWFCRYSAKSGGICAPLLSRRLISCAAAL